MRSFIILLAFMSVTAYAGNSKYDWLLKSAEDKNSDVGAIIVNGTINSEKFTSITANRISEEDKEYRPFIVILANRNGTDEVVSEIDLQSDDTRKYKVKFKDNSIFIRNDTAHHGVYFSQYQFKEINGIFYLIGIESQSITSSAYSASEEELASPGYQPVEMWSGFSANFLTSKAECWLQTFDLQKGESSPEWNEWKAALSSLDNGRSATKGVRRQINIPPAKRVSLKDFSVIENYTPFTCYFDQKKKFHGQ